MKNTFTMQDIADMAAVSRSTVSRALRNDPQISKNVSERIREIAMTVGYRTNPLVATLMENLRAGRGVTYTGTIGVLTADEDPEHWYRHFPAWMRIHHGQVKQANRRGFKLEGISTRGLDTEGRRLTGILEARGIEGLIIAPQPPKVGRGVLSLDWSKFCAATTSYSLREPELHRACHNNFHGILRACRELEKRGYRRIGLFIEKRHVERTDNNFTAGMLVYQQSVPVENRVRMCFVERHNKKDFHSWLNECQPDAVLSLSWSIINWIRETGRLCPEEVGFADLDWSPGRQPESAGIDHFCEEIGAAAIDLVIGQLQRNDRGLPEHPRTLSIDGRWVEGASVRPL